MFSDYGVRFNCRSVLSQAHVVLFSVQLSSLFLLFNSSNFYIEYRASMNILHLVLFWAKQLAPFHVVLSICNFFVIERLHVCTSLPTALLPCGFQLCAVFAVLSLLFLKCALSSPICVQVLLSVNDVRIHLLFPSDIVFFLVEMVVFF